MSTSGAGAPSVRSTFGTSTELLSVLRLMYSRLASHLCPNGHRVPPSLLVAAGIDAWQLPTLSIGKSDEHHWASGTLWLTATTLFETLVDLGRSVATTPARKLVFVNGHGGNIATVTAAFSEIYAERSMEKMSNQPSIKCALRNWWDSDRIRALSKELYPVGEGSHATASEVALTWYKYPETMNRTQLEPRVAPNGSFADAEDYRRNFPDGRIGSDPSQATPEHGKRFFDTAVEDVARDYERWVAR